MLFLPSGEGKEVGKKEVLNSYEEKIREVQKRKTREEKQHEKCLLRMSTRVVVSAILLQTRTSEQGGGNCRCPAVFSQTLSALGRSAGRKVRVK